MAFREAAVAAALLVSTVAPSEAGFLAYSYYAPDYTYDQNTPQPNFIPLDSQNANGKYSLSFRLPKAGKVKITFTAECYILVYRSALLQWADIDLVIDNKVDSPIPPTDGGKDAFCGQDRGFAPVHAIATRSSITVVTTLSAGFHMLQVVGRFGTAIPDVPPKGIIGLSQSTTLIESF